MNATTRPDSLPVENVVVIGSGPAGYTAAIYAARANLQPLLITGFQRGGIPGGQLMTTTQVENFPGFPDGVLGPELMDLMKRQAIRWGACLLEGDADYIDLAKRPYRIQVDKHTVVHTHALIIATGASANRLGLPSEKQFWSHGISTCAICDGAIPQFRDEQLAVVGGGDSACEEAIYLTKYSSQVHMLVRSERFRASAAMVDRVQNNPQITVHWNVEEIDVQGQDWLSSLKLRNRKTGVDGILPVRGLFYAIGHTPNTDLITGQLDLDAAGYLVTQPGRPETSLEGVFAAGDVADTEWRQGITAASSGCQAALAAERWLSCHEGLVTRLRKRKQTKEIVEQQPIATDNGEAYDPSASWQKGSFALRKLYHDSGRPLLVIYTSPGCGPCHVLKPQIERLLNELHGQAQGVEINIEAEPEIAQQAGVNGTPTVQLFHCKKLQKQWCGVKQRSEFRSAIDALLSAPA